MPLLLAAAFPLCTVAPTAHADATSLAEVVVVDQRDAQAERKRSDIQRIVISETEVERFGDATVGDVLRRLPGLAFTGPAGVTKDIRMRGMDKGYTQFLINGQPIPSAKKDRQIQVDRLPADMIECIEIIRNPGATMDSAGVGGTINIVFKSGADDLTRLRAAYGKNGDLNVGDVVLQWSRHYEHFDVLLAASHTVGAEDIEEDKRQYNEDGSIKQRELKDRPVKKDETLLAPRLTWRFGNDRLTLDPFISRGTESKNEPTETYAANGNLSKRTHKDEDKSDTVARFGLRYDAKADWGDWFAIAGSHHARENKDATTREFNAAGLLTKTTVEDETLREGGAYAGFGSSLTLADAHRVSLGMELRTNDYRNRKNKLENGADKSDDKDRFDIDEKRYIAYVQDEWRIGEHHSLTPGVRVERIERDSADHLGEARSNRYTATNPSLHYLWRLNDDTNLRASVAQTYKLPKFDALNPYTTLDKGVLKGGNPDLDPERALGMELGVERYFWNNRGVVGANVYRRNVKDFIQKETRLENGVETERPYNAGEARFYGIEIDWRVPLIESGPHELTLTGNHSELRGRLDLKNSPRSGDVKDLPARITNIGLDWTHRPTLWSAGFNLNHQPRFTTDGINSDGVRELKRRETATLLDLYVGKTLDRSTELRLIAKNVLSVSKEERTVKYATDGSFSSDEWKEETSSPMVMITLESRF